MQGEAYRLAETWWNQDLPFMNDRAIVYGEVGVYHGHNLVSAEKAFAHHPQSILYEFLLTSLLGIPRPAYAGLLLWTQGPYPT